MRLLVATTAKAKEFTEVFIEYLKSLSVGVVGWLSLTKEAKMENPGFPLVTTTFVLTISFLARNQIYQQIQTIFHQYQSQKREEQIWLVLDLNVLRGET